MPFTANVFTLAHAEGIASLDDRTQGHRLIHNAKESQEPLPCVTEGKDPIHERIPRPIAAEVDWGKQREMWEERVNRPLKLG